jgi:hypothetical protein
MNKLLIAAVVLFSTSAMANYDVVVSKRHQSMTIY